MKTLLSLSLMFCSLVSCYGQDRKKVPASIERQVDSIFSKYNNLESPGVAISVIKDGEVILKKGYGSANLEHQVPIDPSSSVFNIASVSKQVTAFAALLLAEQNKLSLDDDVRKHLPELPEFGKIIKLRHLANHTSGMRSDLQLLGMAGWRPGDVIAKENILQILYRQKELNFEPGEDFQYSNSGFILLAEVVAKVSGKTFTEFINENIFKPLQMNDSFFIHHRQEVVKNIAYPYQYGQGKYWKNDTNMGHTGSTGLFTTIADFSKWALNFRQPKVGSKKIIDEMNTLGILNDGQTFGYSLGQFVEEYKGLKHIQHGGSAAGYVAYLGRFPEQDFAVILLGNSSSINARGKSLKVADLFLKDHYKDVSSNEHSPKNSAKHIDIPTTQLDKFSGDYWNDKDYYSRRIYIKNSSLVYSRGIGNESLLTPISKTEFQMEGVSVDLKVRFRTRDRSKTMHISIDGKETDIFERYTPRQNTSEELKQYIGTFYSGELNTHYIVKVEDGNLVVTHARIGRISLAPAKTDYFTSDGWRFSTLKFERNADDNIVGFRLRSSRVRNMQFKKL